MASSAATATSAARPGADSLARHNRSASARTAVATSPANITSRKKSARSYI